MFKEAVHTIMGLASTFEWRMLGGYMASNNRARSLMDAEILELGTSFKASVIYQEEK